MLVSSWGNDPLEDPHFEVQGLATAAGCQLACSCDSGVPERMDDFLGGGFQLFI